VESRKGSTRFSPDPAFAGDEETFTICHGSFRLRTVRAGTSRAPLIGMRPEDLRVRTKRFALAIIDLWRRLPASKEFQEMGDQLRRAADQTPPGIGRTDSDLHRVAQDSEPTRKEAAAQGECRSCLKQQQLI
jgi:hypothetical protein